MNKLNKGFIVCISSVSSKTARNFNDETGAVTIGLFHSSAVPLASFCSMAKPLGRNNWHFWMCWMINELQLW